MEDYRVADRMAWSLAEISASTGLSLAFLRNEVRGGRLPYRKFGRRVLIRNEDLREYLDHGSPCQETAVLNQKSGDDELNQ